MKEQPECEVGVDGAKYWCLNRKYHREDGPAVETKDGSQVTITGELPFSELEKEREAAIKKLGADVEIDGFRKGHIPADVLEKHLGEAAILTEMAERALAHHYAHIVTAHELDVIGQPEVQITKLAKDNPFAFTLNVAVMPEITLPDYRAIAKGVNEQKETAEVTDEERHGQQRHRRYPTSCRHGGCG